MIENRPGEIKRRAPSTAFKPGTIRKSGRSSVRDFEMLSSSRASIHQQQLRLLSSIMNSEKSPPAAVVAASTALLDRAWGKPMQSNEHAGKDGAPLIPTLSVTLTHASANSIRG